MKRVLVSWRNNHRYFFLRLVHDVGKSECVGWRTSWASSLRSSRCGVGSIRRYTSPSESFGCFGLTKVKIKVHRMPPWQLQQFRLPDDPRVQHRYDVRILNAISMRRLIFDLEEFRKDGDYGRMIVLVIFCLGAGTRSCTGGEIRDRS